MKYCSNCGKPVELLIPKDDDRPRYVCHACKIVHYQNPKLVVGCIPEWKNKILLCRRDIEPKKGKWTLPAGYLENGETVEDGAMRETFEETGAVVENLSPYLLFDITHINQLYLMFHSRLVKPDFHVTPESSELRLFDEKEIPWGEIGFKVIEKTLKQYFKDRNTGTFPFRIQQIKQH
ncbi:MAG: NUDIX hydrolase [Desulfobacteraceae bacterium]|nr:NUDIX hydrolase [Desulfobacteraceae bacterium]